MDLFLTARALFDTASEPLEPPLSTLCPCGGGRVLLRKDPPRGDAQRRGFSAPRALGRIYAAPFGCAVRVNLVRLGLPQGEWGGAKLNYGSFPFTVRNGAMDDVQVITV